jgi:hypothetical protein
MRQLYLIATAAMIAAMATVAITATTGLLLLSVRGPASCREAVNGLISLLAGKMDNTALYRETFTTVVNICGPATSTVPAAPAQPAAASDRSACDDLASAMTDLIDDDKMDTPDFVKARTAFAQSCAPP